MAVVVTSFLGFEIMASNSTPSTPVGSRARASPSRDDGVVNSPHSNGTSHHNDHAKKPPLKRESERERAKREAQECLQAVRHEGFQLDGFNLLGVVANPRAGMMGAARHNPSSPSRPGGGGGGGGGGVDSSSSTGGQHAPAGNNATMSEAQTPEPSSGVLSDAVLTLESTLGQVAEQIEHLNLFLEELSREYLGDDGGESHFLEYYYQDEEDQGEGPPVPPQLANLQLSELQAYLEKCGVLAHSLVSLGLETSSLPPLTTTAAATHGAEESAMTAIDEAGETPDVFFETDFDLTQSETFVQLLLQNGNDDGSGSSSNEEPAVKTAQKPQSNASDSLYQPTSQLVPVRDQDALAGHLDRVELALQEQVRLKAGAFFQETTRFRQLQSSIEELLEQVHSLRHSVQAILGVYRQTKDISNHQRQDFELLVQLMDAAMDLIQTKSSIGGLLSANDHLGAAQQIQYGRRLLKQGIVQSEESTSETTADNNTQNKAAPSLELQNMLALSSCNKQFQQYESLVVQSLSEEIVDIFFNWRPSEKERVQEMVQALLLCQALDKAGELYNRRLQQTIRMTVRTTIAEFVESSGSSGSGVTGMTYPDFFNCLEMLIEELQSILQMARQVDEFASEAAIFPDPQKRWTKTVMVSGADLAAKSIAELLRLRKEAHSLITLDEMRQLWDTCLRFTLTVEDYGNNVKAVGLRSTLVGQAKAFLDRTHESNMSALVAALDSERWIPCEVRVPSQMPYLFVPCSPSLNPYQLSFAGIL